VFNLKDIHSLAAGDRIAFKKHTVLRMHRRNISAEDVKTALLVCREIEGYPEDHPLPSGLVLGYVRNRPIHAVIAVDQVEKIIWVITVYEPTLEYWEHGFCQRRRRDEVSGV